MVGRLEASAALVNAEQSNRDHVMLDAHWYTRALTTAAVVPSTRSLLFASPSTTRWNTEAASHACSHSCVERRMQRVHVAARDEWRERHDFATLQQSMNERLKQWRARNEPPREVEQAWRKGEADSAQDEQERVPLSFLSGFAEEGIVQQERAPDIWAGRRGGRSSRGQSAPGQEAELCCR